MTYHIIAFIVGFLMDMMLGDPHWMPHPVRWIGRLTGRLEMRLTGREHERIMNDGCGRYTKRRKTDGKRVRREFLSGVGLVFGVVFCTVAVTAAVLFLAYRVHPYASVTAEAVMTYQLLAAKCLKTESMKVYDRLKARDLEGARKAVSMIVGRDTACLDEEGVAKAAVETVAENTSDGVIAPMLYTALGGPVLGFFYKAVNTMDSMVGYQNERYLYFGRAAAKLDDLVNFLPARLSAWLMIVSAFAGGKDFSGKRAFFVWKRDRANHASPNAAQTESACAGALGVRLAGNASYFGKIVEKPFIGAKGRRAQTEDIRRANRLMYLTACGGEVLCLLFLLAVYGIC